MNCRLSLVAVCAAKNEDQGDFVIGGEIGCHSGAEIIRTGSNGSKALELDP